MSILGVIEGIDTRSLDYGSHTDCSEISVASYSRPASVSGLEVFGAQDVGA